MPSAYVIDNVFGQVIPFSLVLFGNPLRGLVGPTALFDCPQHPLVVVLHSDQRCPAAAANSELASLTTEFLSCKRLYLPSFRLRHGAPELHNPR